MLDWKHKALLGVIVLMVGAAAGKYWLDAHDRILEAKAANGAIEKQRAADKAELDAALKQLQAEKDAIKTSADTVRVINKYIPLPVPVHIDTSDSPLPQSLKDLPNAPPNKPIVIPAEDVVPAGKAVVACEECKANLAASQKDVQALQSENANLQKALKGGSWLHRLGKQVKVIACAGAGAAAGGTQGSKGAAIGAVGGAVVCSLL